MQIPNIQVNLLSEQPLTMSLYTGANVANLESSVTQILEALGDTLPIVTKKSQD